MNTGDLVEVTPLLDESGEIFAFVAKGQQTAEAMQAAIRRYEGTDDYVCTPTLIETDYYRYIPTPPGWDVPYNKRLEHSHPGKGAFLATIAEL